MAALGAQRWVCARFAAPFDPCADDRLVAISPLAMRSNVVVEGVRYVERRPDAGWFITDDEFAGGVGDLEHHHVRHLVRTRPELERFFGLGPGWRIH